MDNRAGEMQVFLRVVDTGSFSEAARMLMMTPSTVSKLIARIEARIGVRLIERSTRRLSLTAEGQIYYERSQIMLADLDDLDQHLTQGAASPGGTVRMTASVGFGTLGIEPLLPAFWHLYPDIMIDLSLSDDIVDLYLDRTDIAFRIGDLPDSSLTAHSLGTARRVIVAAPAYLARRGVPVAFGDLADHDCLGFNFRRTITSWLIADSGRTVERAVRGSLIANNGETVRRMAIAGVGLARLADFHVRSDLAEGRLIEVLPGPSAGDAESVHALSVGTRELPRRVRAFLDFAVPRLRAFVQDGDGHASASVGSV